MLASDVDISMRFHLMDVSKRVCLLDFLHESGARVAEKRTALLDNEKRGTGHEDRREAAKDA